MLQPNTDNLFKDLESNVTYNVKAYRKLSRQEMIAAIRGYHAQKKPKLTKGSTITIHTILGHAD